jgi:hypothetical protein
MDSIVNAAVAQLKPIIEASIGNSTINATSYMEGAFSLMLQDTLTKVNERITSIEEGYQRSLTIIAILVIVFGAVITILILGILRIVWKTQKSNN